MRWGEVFPQRERVPEGGRGACVIDNVLFSLPAFLSRYVSRPTSSCLLPACIIWMSILDGEKEAGGKKGSAVLSPKSVFGYLTAGCHIGFHFFHSFA